MSTAGTVLLVDREAGATERVGLILDGLRDVHGRPEARLVVTRDPGEALTLVRTETPDLVVLGLDGEDLESLARALRGEDVPALVVVLTDLGADLSPEVEADDRLARHIDPTALRTQLRAGMRLRRERERHVREHAELERYRAISSKTRDQLTTQFTQLLEARLPGSTQRGRRLAEASMRLAGRFDVPHELLPDLDSSARLCEIGRVVAVEGVLDGLGAPEPWRYAVSARRFLAHLDAFTGLAELIGCMYENWDGSGHPDHLQMGQIPLRSRILRVLVDFYSALDREGAPAVEKVLGRMSEACGTQYDPKVVSRLQSLYLGTSNEAWVRDTVVVPVTELKAGMVLAEDLFTDTGVMLLARATELSPAAIETILRRHRVDPILQGAAIRRAA